jgi:hypothetical protein
VTGATVSVTTAAVRLRTRTVIERAGAAVDEAVEIRRADLERRVEIADDGGFEPVGLGAVDGFRGD